MASGIGGKFLLWRVSDEKTTPGRLVVLRSKN